MSLLVFYAQEASNGRPLGRICCCWGKHDLKDTLDVSMSSIIYITFLILIIH